MTRLDDLAEDYERARPHLIRVAYAILGSRAEAEDVVSEAWLRLSAADATEPIRDVEAWSTVAVARAALDALRSARIRRETYVGPWLPEPVLNLPAAQGDPADRVTLDDTVSFALLVVLESLTPAERTAWVLHDVFGLPFTEVADVVGRSPQAVRQLAARARGHIREREPRVEIHAGQHTEAVAAFLKAAGGGDLDALIATLDPDVVLTSDGGGEVNAARHPVRGAERVARFLLGIAGNVAPDERLVPVPVNGGPGLALIGPRGVTTVVALTFVDQRVHRIDFVRAPGKLGRLAQS